MSMTRKIELVEVITSVQRRWRWSADEKAAVVQETYAPGMSVSLVRGGMVLRLISCFVAAVRRRGAIGAERRLLIPYISSILRTQAVYTLIAVAR
jgi:hypothetical protein